VNRGEIPIELGDSWLSAKFILVKLFIKKKLYCIIGKALLYSGFSYEIPKYFNPNNYNIVK